MIPGPCDNDSAPSGPNLAPTRVMEKFGFAWCGPGCDDEGLLSLWIKEKGAGPIALAGAGLARIAGTTGH